MRQKRELRKGFLVAAVLLIVALAFDLPVRAQAGTTLSVYPPESDVPLTSQVQIGLLVMNGVNVNSFDITIEYDEDILRLDGWINGDFLTNLSVVKKVEQPGYFRLQCTQMATLPVSGNGILIDLFFYAKVLGTTDIVISAAEFADSQGNMSNPELVNGSITINYTATYTPTATATDTPVFSPTSTRTQTPTEMGGVTRTPTATNTLVPSRTPTNITSSPTRFPTTTQGSLPSTLTPSASGTAFGSQTPGSTGTTAPNAAETEKARQSATPIYVVGSVEGSSRGPVKTVTTEETHEDSETWLWILLVAGVIALVALVIVAFRRKKPKNKGHLYE